MGATSELKKLCGYLNRPSPNIETQIALLEKLSIGFKDLRLELDKRHIKQIRVRDLNYNSWEYRPDFVKLISYLCYIHDIKAYCKLVLEPGHIEPEKRVYLVGPTLITSYIATLIKYLVKCKISMNKANIGVNTIGEVKEHFYEPLFKYLSTKNKVRMKHLPLYNRVLRQFMINNLMFNIPATRLLTLKHWMKSVTLKKPRFKDKYLV